MTGEAFRAGREQLPGSNKNPQPFLKTLSIKKFKPDIKRENEAVWGTERGFEEVLEKNKANFDKWCKSNVR